MKKRRNLILLIILLFYWNSNAQNKQERQIVIIRTASYNGCLLSPKFIINKKDTIEVKSKSFIVKKNESDSLTIEIPYLNGLLKNEIASYSFSTKDPINYFVFKYEFLHSKPSLKKVEGDDLVKFKKTPYVRDKIKEFNLE
jgi:hypothetical protein